MYVYMHMYIVHTNVSHVRHTNKYRILFILGSSLVRTSTHRCVHARVSDEIVLNVRVLISGFFTRDSVLHQAGGLLTQDPIISRTLCSS